MTHAVTYDLLKKMAEARIFPVWVGTEDDPREKAFDPATMRLSADHPCFVEIVNNQVAGIYPFIECVWKYVPEKT